MSALVIFFFLFAGSYLNGVVLLRYLQRTHPLSWKELGEPTLSQSNLGAPRLRLMKFVWRLEFLKLHDTTLSLICSVALLLELGLVGAFIWLMLSK